MIDFLSDWTKDLVTFIVVISFLEMILPKGNMRKFVKMTIGLVIIIVIINPFIKLVQGNIDIEAEVFKNIEKQSSYRNQDNNEFEINQDEQVKNIYRDQIIKYIDVNIIDKTKYKLSEHRIETDENKDSKQYGEIKSIDLTLTEKTNEVSSEIKSMNNIEDVKIDINIKDNSKDIENTHEEHALGTNTEEIEAIKIAISEGFEIAKDKIFIKILADK